ncbi:MAG TPA: gamma-glutamylcyclotransferase family protein [Paucimonas sp.]|nr:gamma-glutamylcyclotransferase family protein [Paucimonas sp.]
MNVFTYGSLMFPEVWRRVVRGDYRSGAGIVADCRRYAIERETYPGMVREAGAGVVGIVYFDVAADDLAALDVFEGADYRRETVAVRLENGAIVPAETYFYLATARLLDTPWDPDAFQMQRFLDTYCRNRFGD